MYKIPDPIIESTLDDFVAAAKAQPTFFGTEAVRDGDCRKVGVAFTGADGRRRILHDPPSYRELHRLVKEAG